MCYPVSMSQIEFMNYLQSVKNDHPEHTPVMRLFKNTAGADVMIHLPKNSWNYVDWLVGRGDIDFGVWVQHCEQTPFNDWPISKLLMYWLWLDDCRRHRGGIETYSNVPPQGYDAFGDPANDR